MADSNLETSGVRIVAEGADKATADVTKVNKVFETFGKTVGNLARDIASGASFDKILSGIQNVGGATTNATGLLAKLGMAGGASGAGIALGMASAVAAIAGVAVAAGAAVLAVKAIGDAVGQAISYARDVNRIQNSTGLSAGPAQSLLLGAQASGNSGNEVAGTFNAIGKNIDSLGEKSEKAFGAMGAAADKADTRLTRLNEDYKSGIADTVQAAAARITEINNQLAESHAAMLARQARADEDYAREVGESRAALGQRIADIEASTAASVASLTQRRSRGTDDYVRESEAAQQDLAQNVLDINTGLNDKLAQLRQSATDDNVSIIENGAAKQATISEQLQSKLASIEEKYSNKRQSIQEKIYDPNTNPILRAFYKTQLTAINGLQKAEEAGARLGASAKEAAARRETEAQLAEVQRRLQREEALEQTQAQRAIQRQQQEATTRQAERLREFTQQTADLTAQIAAENAQRDQQTARARADQATREADLKRSYDRQALDAQASYDKQVADATVAQAKIAAETEKRLANEKQQFDRSVADIEASLAKIGAGGGGGASVAAKGLINLADGFKELGISQEEWNKLSADEKLKLLNDRIVELVNGGHGDRAITMVQNLANVSREAAGATVDAAVGAAAVDDVLKGWGLSQEQIDSLKKGGLEFGVVEAAAKLLVIQIATALIPIIITLVEKFIEFWKEHGPAVVEAIKNVAKWIIRDAVPAVIKFIGFVSDLVDGFVYAVEQIGKAADDIVGFVEGMATKVYDKITGISLDIAKFMLGVFNGVKTQVDKVFEFFGTLKGKLDEFVGFLSRIQLPSWLGGGGGNFQANVTYPQPPAGYGSSGGGGSGFGGYSTKSIPATGAQMAAGSINTKTTTNTNSGNVAHVTVNVSKGDSKSVSDGVAAGMFKAGFTIVR